MNLSKSLEFFDPAKIDKRIHIVGCGAIGSNLCHQLVHLGIPKLEIYDFDRVEAHNIANQMFTEQDIGKLKTEACEDHAKEINPLVEIIRHDEGLDPETELDGYVFLCVDNIDLRRQIVETNKYNPNMTTIMDFRMRLTDAQCYFAVCKEYSEINTLLNTMDFTHDEATTSTPVSACGVELSVYYAPNTVVSVGVSNFVKYILGQNYFNMFLVDMDMFSIMPMKWKQRKKKSAIVFKDI